jgi:hypothetical protein
MLGRELGVEGRELGVEGPRIRASSLQFMPGPRCGPLRTLTGSTQSRPSTCPECRFSVPLDAPTVDR